MSSWKTILMFLLTSLFISAALAQSPAGKWVSKDDKTGKKRAIIQLNTSGNTLSGTVIRVYPQPGDTGICAKCPGAFKNKPVQGLQVVWGLKDKGNGEWVGGHILDPKSGRIYRAKMTLKGNKLYVRGYVGFSVLGRTQVWYR